MIKHNKPPFLVVKRLILKEGVGFSLGWMNSHTKI